jgi:hypothetical protein
MSAELATLTPAERERYWAKKAQPLFRKIKNQRVRATPAKLRKTG